MIDRHLMILAAMAKGAIRYNPLCRCGKPQPAVKTTGCACAPSTGATSAAP